MPKFHVKVREHKVNIYEIVADDMQEAEQRYTEGKLISTEDSSMEPDFLETDQIVKSKKGNKK